MTAAAARPLVLTRRVDGPWLAIRAGTPAEAASVVLVGDPRAPLMWRRLDVSALICVGRVGDAPLIPLAEFGVCCTLYSRTFVMSVWRAGVSRARRSDGSPWAWEGSTVERIKVDRSQATIDALRHAIRECNTIGRVRS